MASSGLDLAEILRRLRAADLDFIVIGGIAMVIHGSSKATFDVDVMYRRSRDEVRKVVEALADLHPRPRGFPPDLPFIWDEATLNNVTVATLTTDLGDVDFLAEAEGSGGYESLKAGADEYDFRDMTLRVASLHDLLNMKRAAGRSKDDVHIAELEDWLAEEAAGEAST